MTRMQSRMMHGPAVVSFSNHYGKALDEALKLLAPTMWPAAIQSLLLQVLIEWEGVNLAYEGVVRWRRGESNPRPRSLAARRLHA
jgi:hypothetical protein